MNTTTQFTKNQEVMIRGTVKTHPLKEFKGTVFSVAQISDNKIAVNIDNRVHSVSLTQVRALDVKDKTTPSLLEIYEPFYPKQRVKVVISTVEHYGTVSKYAGTAESSVTVLLYSGAEVVVSKTLVSTINVTSNEPARSNKLRAVYSANQKVNVTIGFIEQVAEVLTYTAYSVDTVNILLHGEKLEVSKERVSAIPYVPKTIKKFVDCEAKTQDEEYIAKLFCAKTHDEVVRLGIEGVSMIKYRTANNKEWFAMIPQGLTADEKVPCLIAHTDLHPNLTHPTPENLEYDGGKFSSPTGLGADDRAGIFAINRLLLKYPGKFMVLFPDKEEVGLLGSTAFTKTAAFKEFDQHASMYISIDRRRGWKGEKAIATYGSDNTNLNKWVAALTGREIVTGSSTDCKALASASTAKIPCFNFSCGYTREHSKSETLYFSELLETVKDVGLLLEDIRAYETYSVDPKKTYVYDKKTYGTHNFYSNYGMMLDSIFIDGVEFLEDDLQNLLDMYAFYTGEEYNQKLPILAPALAENDIVSLDKDLIIGQVYGGEVLTKELYDTLASGMWLVTDVGFALHYELTSEDGTTICSDIPRIWLLLDLPEEETTNSLTTKPKER